MAYKKTIYSEAVYYLSWIIHAKWLRRHIPIERLIRPIEKTDRTFYGLERRIYRQSLSIQSAGRPLSLREYRIYKLIAQKYNWFYIKELHDD